MVVYECIVADMKQEVLVHCPRRASLRPRLAIPKYTDFEEPTGLTKNGTKRKPKDALPDLSRQYYSLTQVDDMIRDEFNPIHVRHQEIGIDLTQVTHYIHYFINPPGIAIPGRDILNANITVVIHNSVKDASLPDLLPLLEIAASSCHVSVGFARYDIDTSPLYFRGAYNPDLDVELRDLYRLLGRKVLPNRKCSAGNSNWEAILRSGSLAAVRICRQPQPGVQHTVMPIHPSHLHLFGNRHLRWRPYIQILFKRQFALPWMTSDNSSIPAGWLNQHGFDRMQYFSVKVGRL